jgi:hypothetical protein
MAATTNDPVLDQHSASNGAKGPSVSEKLVHTAHEAGVELFHDPFDVAYAAVEVDGHTETWPVRSRHFKAWLRRRHHDRLKKGASRSALDEAADVLEGDALSSEEHEVHVRVAGDRERIVIDLGDDRWRAIEITASGWRILEQHPVRFSRPAAMLALPEPVAGGSLDELRPFVNVDEAAWPLLAAWPLAALRPRFPFPVLFLRGEQGSAKSTTARVIRALVDPNRSPLRSAPHKIEDLMVSARSSWTMAYDNVSKIGPTLSDAICRLATGGGLSKRQLYTDGDEYVIDVMRPVLITGIGAIAHRGDLLDRALLIECPVIDEESRMTEEAFWNAFAEVHARVLGAVCDALSEGLRNVGNVELTRLPRMADFVKWAVATEGALSGKSGTFLAAYKANRAEADIQAIEMSVIGPALLKVAEAQFFGSAGELLVRLEDHAGGASKRDDWPTPRGLVDELERLAPNMRRLGFKVERTGVGRSGGYRYVIAATRERWS